MPRGVADGAARPVGARACPPTRCWSTTSARPARASSELIELRPRADRPDHHRLPPVRTWSEQLDEVALDPTARPDHRVPAAVGLRAAPCAPQGIDGRPELIASRRLHPGRAPTRQATADCWRWRAGRPRMLTVDNMLTLATFEAIQDSAACDFPGEMHAARVRRPGLDHDRPAPAERRRPARLRHRCHGGSTTARPASTASTSAPQSPVPGNQADRARVDHPLPAPARGRPQAPAEHRRPRQGGGMTGYLIRRVLQMVVVVLGVTLDRVHPAEPDRDRPRAGPRDHRSAGHGGADPRLHQTSTGSTSRCSCSTCTTSWQLAARQPRLLLQAERAGATRSSPSSCPRTLLLVGTSLVLSLLIAIPLGIWPGGPPQPARRPRRHRRVVPALLDARVLAVAAAHRGVRGHACGGCPPRRRKASDCPAR